MHTRTHIVFRKFVKRQQKKKKIYIGLLKLCFVVLSLKDQRDSFFKKEREKKKKKRKEDPTQIYQKLK